MQHLMWFQEKLAAKGGAALVTSHQNQYYLSGFPYEDGFVVVFPDAAYLLADFRYFEAAQAGVSDEFTVIRPEGGMLAEVAALLKKHNATTLWVEEGNVTLADLERFKKALGDVEICGGLTPVFSQLRIVKDQDELEALTRAQSVTDAAFAHVLEFIEGGLHKGVREIDVALELEFFMRKNGSVGTAFDTIAVSGTASSLPHGVPRDLPLEKGFLTMDFGARIGGYCADMTRTVVIGRADEEMKRLYDTVLTAQRAALAAAGPGVGCRALDKVARDIIDNAGYKGCFGHSLGHGIGIDVHEEPRVSFGAAEDAVLVPGQIISCEPGIYIAGKYGCRIEDMIAITERGIHNFTKSPKELIEIV